jgi:hypothetical protein
MSEECSVVDSDFYPSWIPDPKTATNFTKLIIILVLKCLRKKFGPIFKEL